MDAYIGLITLFAGNFAPAGWAFCQGQILNVSQYQAVFAILGTQYGGNGQTTFALPNLASRVPIGFGQGPGLSQYTIGEIGGVEETTLTVSNLATHTHTVAATGAAIQAGNGMGVTTDPTGNYLVNAGDGVSATYPSYAPQGSAGTLANLAGPTVNLSGLAVSSTGSSTPVKTLPPFLAMNFIICLQGLYPTRS